MLETGSNQVIALMYLEILYNPCLPYTTSLCTQVPALTSNIHNLFLF